MKKALLILVVLSLVALGATAVAKDKASTVTGWVSDQHCGAAHNKPGGEECVKKCAQNGLALVSDGDNKVWNIDNPDAVKGHEGHHVKVTGTPNAEKGSIHIDKVEMVKDKSEKSEKKSS